MSFIEGTVVRFAMSTPFTSIANTVVNPDVVVFTWSVQGQTPTVYTWTNGGSPPDPSGFIVNTATGCFQVDLPTIGLSGTLSYQWSGKPGVSGLDTTKTTVTWDGTTIISASAF